MFEAFLILALSKLLADHRDQWGPWLLLAIFLALVLVVSSLLLAFTRLI